MDSRLTVLAKAITGSMRLYVAQKYHYFRSISPFGWLRSLALRILKILIHWLAGYGEETKSKKR